MLRFGYPPINVYLIRQIIPTWLFITGISREIIGVFAKAQSGATVEQLARRKLDKKKRPAPANRSGPSCGLRLTAYRLLTTVSRSPTVR